ncbi:MAG: aminopeptidase P family N-terminal domain-containing protein [Alloacidobacterium sp.]
MIEIDWPEFGLAACPPPPSTSELEARIDNLRARMEESKITHTVVYGDREHFANLTYLTGFDPRFEEALLIIGRTATPLILVGNECEAYLGISSLYAAGRMRHERFQSFSLWVNRGIEAAPCARSSRTKASLKPQLWAP